jgi:hypothetical protein
MAEGYFTTTIFFLTFRPGPIMEAMYVPEETSWGGPNEGAATYIFHLGLPHPVHP